MELTDRIVLRIADERYDEVSDSLDEAVRVVKSQEAIEINDKGLRAQVLFLLETLCDDPEIAEDEIVRMMHKVCGRAIMNPPEFQIKRCYRCEREVKRRVESTLKIRCPGCGAPYYCLIYERCVVPRRKKRKKRSK